MRTTEDRRSGLALDTRRLLEAGDELCQRSRALQRANHDQTSHLRLLLDRAESVCATADWEVPFDSFSSWRR